MPGGLNDVLSAVVTYSTISHHF